jgi:O-antigen ligase
MIIYKTKKIFFAFVLLSGPILMLLLPSSIEQKMYYDIAIVPVFIINLIYIPFFFSILKKSNLTKLDLAIYISITFVLISCITASDNNLQRFLISIQFFVPYFILRNIDINIFSSYFYNLFFIVFLYLSIQTILIATNILVIDTGYSYNVGNYIRRGTTAGPPTYTGHVLLLLFSLLISLNKKTKHFYLLLPLSFLSIFFTGTRSALMALVFGIFLYMLLNNMFVKRAKLVLLLLITIFIFNSQFNIFDTIKIRNIEAMESSDITSGRLERWNETFEILSKDKQYLFFGYGGAQSPYFNTNLIKINPKISPHNVYISFLFEHGILGLSSFLLVILFVIKNIKDRKSLDFMLLISFLLFSFNTEVVTRDFLFSFLFWFLYFAMINKQKKSFYISHNPKNVSNITSECTPKTLSIKNDH